MGVSSMFIMLLTGGTSTSFTSAVIFVSAAVGLSTFTSRYVCVFKTSDDCYGTDAGFFKLILIYRRCAVVKIDVMIIIYISKTEK